MKSKKPISNAGAVGLSDVLVALGVVVLTGLIAVPTLNPSPGVSAYWLVVTGTSLAVVAAGGLGWFLTRPHPPVFVFDWAGAVEGLVALAVFAALGLFRLAGSIVSGVLLVMTGAVLLCLVAAAVWYVVSRGPETTWDDDDCSDVDC